MAYDQERYEEIKNMEFGDLVHTMISNFDPTINHERKPYEQDIEYFWAYETLNLLMRVLVNSKEQISGEGR